MASEANTKLARPFKPSHIVRPILVLVIISAIALSWWLSNDKGKEGLYYGTIEGQSADVAAAVSGQIVELAVQEGQVLEANEIIAQLDDSEARVRLEKANLLSEVSQEQVSKAKEPARDQEIAIQANTVDQLKSQQEQLSSTLKKAKSVKQQALNTVNSATQTATIKQKALDDAKKLEQTGSASTGAVDMANLENILAQTTLANAKLQAEIADAEIKSLEQQVASAGLAVASAQERLSLLQSGLDAHDQSTAKLSSEASAQDVALADLTLARYTVKNLEAGVVESVNFSIGEFVSAGAPIITVQYPNKLSVKLYINESALNDIQIGSNLNLSLVSEPNKTTMGKVVKISNKAMYTPMNVVTTKDRERLVYEIKIELDSHEALNSGFVAGMMVEAFIPHVE